MTITILNSTFANPRMDLKLSQSPWDQYYLVTASLTHRMKYAAKSPTYTQFIHSLED